MHRAKSDKEYQGRVYRDRHLKRCAHYDLETMLYALKGQGMEVVIDSGEYPIKGHNFAPPHKYCVRMDQWFATGYTEAGAIARMLALMLDGSFTPLT